MKEFFNVLRKCILFNNISDENLIALLGCLDAKVYSFEKKEVIIEEGEKARYIGILLSGSAQIVRNDYFGNRSIVAGIKPSEMFCESFACAEADTVPVSVIADEPCKVLLIDCHRIMHSCSHACEFHQRTIFNLMKTMAIKNILFHQKIQITSNRTTREKLMAYLMLQAEHHKSNRFCIPFDRQELADYLQVERSGLSAEISKMRKEGIIKSNKKYFELL